MCENEMKSKCRLCAKKQSFEMMLPIAASEEIMEKIIKLLPVVIIPGDPLPQSVCKSCKQKLDLFNEFFEESLQSEKSFRTSVSFIPEEPPPVVNPIVKFNKECNLFGPAFKAFFKEQPKIITGSQKRLSSQKLYSCANCYRIWVSEAAAQSHSCPPEAVYTSSSSAMDIIHVPDSDDEVCDDKDKERVEESSTLKRILCFGNEKSNIPTKTLRSSKTFESNKELEQYCSTNSLTDTVRCGTSYVNLNSCSKRKKTELNS